MTNGTLLVESILAKPLHAVVGINRPYKAPQLSVVWFDWDGATLRFSTTRKRAKFRNLIRNPDLSILINDAETSTYLVAYGRAQIEETGHPELSRRLFARYLPDRDPETAPHEPDRVVISLKPSRMITGS